MPLAIVITVLGLGLILVGVLWRQQTAPRRLILIAAGVLLLLLGGWKLLQAQDEGRRAEPRSWSAEPATGPSLSVAFGPEDLPGAAVPKPDAATASSPAMESPALARSSEPPAKPRREPASPIETAPEPTSERRLAATRAAPVTPAQTRTTLRQPRRDHDPAVGSAPARPLKRADHASHDEDTCCRWLPAEGGYVDESGWREAESWSAPSVTSVPAPAYREASPCAVGRADVQGGICVEIRNALGQGQQSESLQLFVEGRPVGQFNLDQTRPSQSLAVWFTYPGRFGYRLVGHVDYADGRYALNSQGVFDARPGAALDVRITPWCDQVFLELDPWSTDVSNAR